MKKLVILLFAIYSSVAYPQTKDKVAVIDTKYILKTMPEVKEAETELKKRANEWDAVIQQKKKEIKDLKDLLAVEKNLLTPQLINEKQEDISILETELLNYQQEKYGPNGDYFIQKTTAIKAAQDQIFAIVNEIVEKKKYSVVIDKSDEENSILYSNARYEISDQVIKQLEKNRSKGKLSKKELAALEKQEKEEAQKEKQRDRRQAFAEKQKELQRLKEDEIIENYKKEKPNAATSFAEEQKRKIEQQKSEKQKRTEEIKKLQLKKIEEQKKKIEAQKAAVEAAKKKSIEEAEKKKQKIIDEKKKIAEQQQKAIEEQKKKQDELTRKQLLRKIEVEKIKEQKLNERKKRLEEQKNKIEAEKAKKKKELEEQKKKLQKEQQEKQIK